MVCGNVYGVLNSFFVKPVNGSFFEQACAAEDNFWGILSNARYIDIYST